MDTITLWQNDILFIKETATSKILFTKDRIYKVKKDVLIIPFIDYSSKARRYTSILKEFSKGIAYSPEIYVCLVILDAPDINLEPCICMNRGNPLSDTLFNYLSAHGCNKFNLENLLQKIKQFHLSTGSVLPSAEHPIIGLRQRFAMLCEEAVMLNKELENDYLKLIDRYVAYYDSKYKERCNKRYIRELHGDLHSNNILYDEKNFFFFDFLDFDDSYTTGDYLYDVGFFLADMYFFDVINTKSNSIEKIAEFFNDEPVLLLLFSAYGAFNRANVFEFHNYTISDIFYDLSYILLRKGRRYL